MNFGNDKACDTATVTDGDEARYQRSMERENRSMERQNRNCDDSVSTAPPDDDHELVDINEGDAEKTHQKEVQTDMTMSTIDAMQAEIQSLKDENEKLKKKIKQETSKFDRDFFEDQDDKVEHFTGLPSFRVLDIVLELIEDYIPYSKESALTKFQQLVLALMKLRLNLSDMDIAQRFGIDETTSCKVFMDMIDLLFVSMRAILTWPTREVLNITMPTLIRDNFGDNVVSILDCLEVLIETPPIESARLETWSPSMHNYTLKCLIGIAPQGAITYLSKGWGGAAPNSHLVAHCDILPKLLPDDVVLADSTFDIADSIAITGAKLVTIEVNEETYLLSGEELEKNEAFEDVRSRVEKIIGSLRQKYRILQGTMPIDLITCEDSQDTVDKICVVCCALFNLSPSVVPID